jgi:hypothetical protein
VLLDVMPRRRDHLVEHSPVDRCGIGHHLGRGDLHGGQCSLEEPAGGVRVAAVGRRHRVYGG